MKLYGVPLSPGSTHVLLLAQTGVEPGLWGCKGTLGLQQQKGCRIAHGAVHFWKGLQLFQRVLSAGLVVTLMQVPDNDSQLHVRAHILTL